MRRRALSRRAVLGAAAAGAVVGVLPGCGHNDPDGGAELRPFIPGQMLPWTNWSGTQSCVPSRKVVLEAESQLAEALAQSPTPIRPLGAGHSFSALVPTQGTLIATDLLNGIVAADSRTQQAEVWAGTRLHNLGPMLAAVGQALPNQPDIDYPSLGGATATSTHGTGTSFGSLSSYVIGLNLVTPSGEMIECDAQRRPEVFNAARVSLGALGLITRLKLQNVAALRLTELTRAEPLEDVLADLPHRFASNRNFEFLALPHTRLCVTVTTNESKPEDTAVGTDDPQTVYKLRQLYRWVRWIPAAGDATYEGLLKALVGDAGSTVRVGPSFEVLAHHRIVRFREMEYTVPVEAGPDCLREILKTIRDTPIPVVFPIEYRHVKKDDIWLSPFQDRDGASISVHQYGDTDYRPYFAAIEPIFWKYHGRPHWGKLHTLNHERLAALYPHMQEFRELRQMLDPDGRMLNSHLKAVLGA
jgi:FAD-linked oxidoreductase